MHYYDAYSNRTDILNILWAIIHFKWWGGVAVIHILSRRGRHLISIFWVLICVYVCLSCLDGSDGEAYRVTAQMVLVCCWRTMKEVSMLLGHLCQSMTLYCPLTHPDSRGVITEDQVRHLSGVTWSTIHFLTCIHTLLTENVIIETAGLSLKPRSWLHKLVRYNGELYLIL